MTSEIAVSFGIVAVVLTLFVLEPVPVDVTALGLLVTLVMSPTLLSIRRERAHMVTLYELDGCPYCEAVADRLEELDIEYESVWVDALHSERDEVKRVSGQRQVPVIVDEEYGVTMAESERILDYLDTTYA